MEGASTSNLELGATSLKREGEGASNSTWVGEENCLRRSKEGVEEMWQAPQGRKLSLQENPICDQRGDEEEKRGHDSEREEAGERQKGTRFLKHRCTS